MGLTTWPGRARQNYATGQARLDLSDAGSHSLHSSLNAVLEMELGQDVPNVVLHRVRAQVELLGNRGVFLPHGEELKDSNLAFRQGRTEDFARPGSIFSGNDGTMANEVDQSADRPP